jgi:hypothetical protein
MVVKLKLVVSMRNGDKKQIIVEEKDPKGYLVDKETGNRKEISLTDREVQVEYSRKIVENVEKKKPIHLVDNEGRIYVINSYDISSIDVEVV